MFFIERMNRTGVGRMAHLLLSSAVVLSLGCPFLPQAPPGSFTLTVNVEGQGTVEPSSGSFVAGTEVTLTASPASGWQFDRWEGDASGNANPLAITINANMTITAVFTSEEAPGQPTPTVTLNVDVEGEGRVELDPPGGEYAVGTDVTLTAVAEAGWRFDRWEDGATGSDNPLTLSMNDDTDVGAIFVEEDEPGQVQLTVEVEGNGRVELDPPGGNYDVGTDVTARAIPDSGWQFDEWRGDVTDTNNPLTLTLTEDTEVTAVFSVVSGGGGGGGGEPPSAPLTLEITSPENLTLTNQTTIEVTGTVSDSDATVTVNGVAAAIVSGTFTASNVPLNEGTNVVAATARRGADVETANVTVIRDTTAPNVAIEFPTNGLVLSDTTITVVGSVNDIVVGTVNQENCSVTVQGPFGTVGADITNRTFIVQNLQLVPGPNTITATATDSAGNTGTPVSVTVTQQAVAGQQILLFGGNNQSGVAGQTLDNPVMVQTVDPDGNPLAGRFVTFRVVRNNGTLTPAGGPSRSGGNGDQGSDTVTVQTDVDGFASINWTLGNRAGVGNNRLEVSAIGFAAPTLICASATSGDCAMLAPVAGETQVGPVGEPLTRAFEIVAFDAGGNRCANAPITFTVDMGGGNFDGPNSITVETNADGMAAVTLTLGPDAGINNNVVSATFPGLTELPVVFTASAVNAGSASQTTFTGMVLDTENRPVPGATVTIEDSDPAIQTTTDDEGLFTLTQVPSGRQHLFVNGATSTRPGVWPFLEFAVDVVSGVQNTLGMPIFLPELDGDAFLTVGGSDVDLSMSGVEGFSVKIFANSVTFPDGSTTGSMGVTQVSSDQVPMPPQGGAAPPWVGTLQPPGVRFDPPAQVTAPNSLGLPPGQIVDMFSFDHDLNQFVGIGTGTVQADGATIVSDPGSGIRKSGWFFDCPPPPPPNCTCACDDNDDCTADTCSGPPNCVCSHTLLPGPGPSAGPTACCSGRAFNTATQGCCIRSFFFKDQVYTLATQGCCDGTVYNLTTQGCCPISPIHLDKVYNKATLCCEPGGFIVQKYPITFFGTTCLRRVAYPAWVFVFDGCSLPISPGFNKDNPAGAVDTWFSNFTRPGLPLNLACDNHDRCYQTCNPAAGARLACDTAMLIDMSATCTASTAGAAVVTDCLNWAGRYFSGLRGFGGLAFDSRQRQVCQCCP